MIVKIFGPEELKQAYIIDDGVDIRRMLIDCANQHDSNVSVLTDIKQLFEKFTKCNSSIVHFRIIVFKYMCVLVDERNKKVYHIHFYKHMGNCVDRFARNILENDAHTILYLLQYIEERSHLRSIETDYHSSVLFEQDFADMTRMKEAAHSIIDNINKFQERITLSDYTS